MDLVRSRRLLLTMAWPVLAVPTVAGCAGGPEDEVARDPAPSTPTLSAPSETAPTTTDGLPDFGPHSYSYTLEVTCYCVDAGTPVRVTVVDDEVSEAVYLRGGPGVRKGATAGEASHLTIDDIIVRAENPDAATVDVDWPDGQDHPTSVYVDLDERMVDEEVGYRISDVEIH